MTTVNVSVTVDDAGFIICSPSPVVVTQPDTMVAFTLGTDGFFFPSTGAVVISSPDANFPYTSWTISNTSATVLDRYTSTGDHSYTVTVEESDTGRRLSHDPIIRNGN